MFQYSLGRVGIWIVCLDGFPRWEALNLDRRIIGYVFVVDSAMYYTFVSTGP